MPLEKGLPPIYTANSRVLVLGTFPSAQSREKGEYYGNARNRFWKEFCAYAGVAVPNSYNKKVELLHKEGIALWDLVETCEIIGSSDSDIKNPTFNKFDDLFKKAKIDVIVFNGQNAFKFYKKHVGNLFKDYVVAPSTSPIPHEFDSDLWKMAFMCARVPFIKATRHYIKLCDNTPLYKVIGKDKVLDDQILSKTCDQLGITPQNKPLLEKAILRHIKIEKL